MCPSRSLLAAGRKGIEQENAPSGPDYPPFPKRCNMTPGALRALLIPAVAAAMITGCGDGGAPPRKSVPAETDAPADVVRMADAPDFTALPADLRIEAPTGAYALDLRDVTAAGAAPPASRPRPRAARA